MGVELKLENRQLVCASLTVGAIAFSSYLLLKQSRMKRREPPGPLLPFIPFVVIQYTISHGDLARACI
jgi:hypothetical protein